MERGNDWWHQLASPGNLITNEKDRTIEKRKANIAMKLHEALFREHWRAYQVLGEYVDQWDDFSGWDLQPLSGPTLAAEDVDDVFQGLFIIAAQVISSDGAPRPCYMDLTLPERIAEHCFLQIDGHTTRRRGLHLQNGTVIPAIGIENFGACGLFFAKENPSAGIDVLKKGMQEARDRTYLAHDLAFLLRDEKRYEEAIEAFTVFLAESQAPELAPIIYKERARLYAAIGQLDKAEADKRQFAVAFEKNYGHAPGPHEM